MSIFIFMIRAFLGNEKPNSLIQFVSALTYSAIYDIHERCKALSDDVKAKRYKQAYLALNKGVDLFSKPLLGFPCKLR